MAHQVSFCSLVGMVWDNKYSNNMLLWQQWLGFSVSLIERVAKQTCCFKHLPELSADSDFLIDDPPTFSCFHIIRRIKWSLEL